MELDEYQRRAHETATSDDIEIYTLGLSGEAGSVASAIKKIKRDNPAKELVQEEIKRELGDALWYLSEIAFRYDIKLSESARRCDEAFRVSAENEGLSNRTDACSSECGTQRSERY